MPPRKLKPTSPGRRFRTVSDFAEITKTEPEKSLLEPLKKTGGRNVNGRITTRHQGGGHKRRYRKIDFKRTKDGVPAKVASIEYDPNRSARDRAAPLRGRRQGVHPRARATQGRPDGRVRARTPTSGPGNALPAREHPDRHARPQRRAPARAGAARWRAAPARASSSWRRTSPTRCCAFPPARSAACRSSAARRSARSGTRTTRTSRSGKAGRSRWLGKRPTVRGSAMNPVDHPHGGGEGKSKGGRHPVTPWGVPTLGKRTRSKHKESDRLIVRGRRRGKERR